MHNVDDVDLRLDLSRACARLTERQFEVVNLLARGYTQAEIGEQLGIGRRTVGHHLASAAKRLAFLLSHTSQTGEKGGLIDRW